MFVGTRLGQTKLTVSCHFWLQKFNAKLGLSFKYLFYIDILKKKKKKKKKIPLWINDNALGKAPSPCCFYTVCLYSLLYTLISSVPNTCLSVMYKFPCESMTMSWAMSYLHLDTSHQQSRLLDKLTRCNEPSVVSGSLFGSSYKAIMYAPSMPVV